MAEVLKAYASVVQAARSSYEFGLSSPAWVRCNRSVPASTRCASTGQQTRNARARFGLKDLRESRSLRPFRCAQFFSREIQRVVGELLPACQLVHVDSLLLVPHLERAVGSKRRDQRLVLDFDDIETDLGREWLRLAPPRTWQERIAERIDLAVLGRYQRRTLRPTAFWWPPKGQSAARQQAPD
jgi:hypothetical protein